MTEQDWFVTNDGQCQAWEVISQGEELTQPYRIYRFLTDLEDVLAQITDDQSRLQAICPLRKLLTLSCMVKPTTPRGLNLTRFTALRKTFKLLLP